MWWVIFIWIVVSIIIGSFSGIGCGFSFFLAPVVYMISYALSQNHLYAALASLSPMGIAVGVNEDKKEKASKRREEELAETRWKFEERRRKEAREQEVRAAYHCLLEVNIKDAEANDLCNDYKNYYITDHLYDNLKRNFEDRIIAKAKPLIEAEEFRRQEQEAIQEALEQEQYEKEQAMLAAKYGAKKDS